MGEYEEEVSDELRREELVLLAEDKIISGRLLLGNK